MRPHPLALLFVLPFLSCSPAPCPPVMEEDAPTFTGADAATIRDAMDAQVEDWNAGDIPGFMAAYAQDICFTGRAGLTCGRDKVLEQYQRNYPDREAMGTLSFSVEELINAGPGHAWMTGEWSLARVRDTLSGGFTLLWERRDDDWLIVRDHSH